MIRCSISRTVLRRRCPFADDAARTRSPRSIPSIQSTLSRSTSTCSSPPLISSRVSLFLRASKAKLPQHPSVQVYKIKHLAPRGSNQAFAVRRRSISSPCPCRRIQLTHTIDDTSIKVAPVCFRRRCQLPPRTPFRLHRIATVQTSCIMCVYVGQQQSPGAINRLLCLMHRLRPNSTTNQRDQQQEGIAPRSESSPTPAGKTTPAYDQSDWSCLAEGRAGGARRMITKYTLHPEDMCFVPPEDVLKLTAHGWCGI